MLQAKNIVRKEKGIELGDDLLLIADSLSKYGVAPRYPNEIEVDERQVKKALTDSEAILNWVEDVIAAKREQQNEEL